MRTGSGIELAGKLRLNPQNLLTLPNAFHTGGEVPPPAASPGAAAFDVLEKKSRKKATPPAARSRGGQRILLMTVVVALLGSRINIDDVSSNDENL